MVSYHLALGGKPAAVLGGLSGDQRFYIAYGQSWREIWSDGLTRRIALSDEHSPSAYRVNGVVRNDPGGGDSQLGNLVATAMRLSEGAVKFHLHQGRVHLRLVLTQRPAVESR